AQVAHACCCCLLVGDTNWVRNASNGRSVGCLVERKEGNEMKLKVEKLELERFERRRIVPSHFYRPVSFILCKGRSLQQLTTTKQIA
ncbi:hypothetical protein WUBG_08019, partial [Wuchereria bancrofti]